MKVPFLNFEPMHKALRAEMQQAFENVYDGYWYIQGQQLINFENTYAQFNQVNHAVGVSNGLDALFLSLKVAGIKAGDEVIVPSNTYIATWLAVSYIGAKPIPVEPDVHTYNIDVTKIEAAITAKTKAIMPVHLYGQAAEMDAVLELANKYNLKVIEDNAQAQGATFNGQLTGSFGHANGTSFYPGKNIGALGDAGAVTTNNAAYAEQLKMLRNYGSAKKYYNVQIGYNMRLDELQAAFLQVKMNYVNEWSTQRQQIAQWYSEALQGIGDIILPTVAEKATHVYHLFVIRTQQRNALQQYLQEQGIGTLIHYPVPPHLQQAYQPLGYLKGSFPIAEELAETSLSLPVWIGISQQELTEVVNCVKQFFNNGN